MSNFKTIDSSELVTATGGINWGAIAQQGDNQIGSGKTAGGPTIFNPRPPIYTPSPTFDRGPQPLAK